MSLSQARRAAGFLPFAFAFAGGCGVLAHLLGPLAAPLALAAGIVFQLAYPGDFDYALTDGGPPWATWIALAGGVAALVVGFSAAAAARTRRQLVAAALFLLPVGRARALELVAVRGASAQPALARARRARSGRRCPAGSTVYSDPEASYRIAAFAPVYVCVAPPGHVADTEENRPRERVERVPPFRAHGCEPSCPGAGGSSSTARASTSLPRVFVYRDPRWTLYRLAPRSRRRPVSRAHHVAGHEVARRVPAAPAVHELPPRQAVPPRPLRPAPRAPAAPSAARPSASGRRSSRTTPSPPRGAP